MKTKRILGLLALGALLTFTLSLVNAPQAFADVKAVVTLECNPHNDAVEFAQSSSASPVSGASLVGTKCTDAMKFLDDNHFKVKEILRGPGSTTINEFPGSSPTFGTPPWNSRYLLIFFLD